MALAVQFATLLATGPRVEVKAWTGLLTDERGKAALVVSVGNKGRAPSTIKGMTLDLSHGQSLYAGGSVVGHARLHPMVSPPEGLHVVRGPNFPARLEASDVLEWAIAPGAVMAAITNPRSPGRVQARVYVAGKSSPIVSRKVSLDGLTHLADV